MGSVTAVCGVDGRRVHLDWKYRIDALPEAKAALGAALGTPWAKTLLARIFDAPLDMDVRHFINDGTHLSIVDDTTSSERLLIVNMPDGRIDLIPTCGDTTVASVRHRVQSIARAAVSLTVSGRVLHDSERVADVCRDETTDVYAIEEEEPRFRATSSRSITFRTFGDDDALPVITAELMQPLCWTRPGRDPTVWRRGEAFAAVAVTRHAGIEHMLPVILRHLAIPPSQWLRGPSVSGRVHRASARDTVTFMPDVPLPGGARLRLHIEGGGGWFDE